jgi:DNA-binding beta-propeller fold protein YncE
MKLRLYIIAILSFIIIIPNKVDAKLFKKKAKAKKVTVFYPSAPDTARIQFLTTFSTSTVFGKRSAFSSFVLGPEQEKLIMKPFGIFIRNGKLYICDPGVGGLEILNFETKSYSIFSPSDKGRLKSGLNCYVDKNENLYVADAQEHRVVIFDSLNNYLDQLVDTGESFKPTEVYASESEIWVTNPSNHTLNIYDKKTHKLLRYFNESHNYQMGDEGFLYSPYNMYLGNNTVYVTDFGDSRVKKFDLDGRFISSVGSYGDGMGQFVRPKGIACDKEDNLYVVDAGFENVQIFNSNNQLLMFFGGPYKGPGDMWLPARVIIDYDNIKYFTKYVDSKYDLNYLIIVSNQYGPDKINVYGGVSLKK